MDLALLKNYNNSDLEIMSGFIKADLEKLNCSDPKVRIDYKFILGEICEISQRIEFALRTYIKNKKLKYDGDIWKKGSGGLLGITKKTKEFEQKQFEVLEKIIELRNWAMHDLVQEEREYIKSQTPEWAGKKNAPQIWSGIYNAAPWVAYRNEKLAVTKGLMFEFVDFIEQGAGVISHVKEGKQAE